MNSQNGYTIPGSRCTRKNTSMLRRSVHTERRVCNLTDLSTCFSHATKGQTNCKQPLQQSRSIRFSSWQRPTSNIFSECLSHVRFSLYQPNPDAVTLFTQVWAYNSTQAVWKKKKKLVFKSLNQLEEVYLICCVSWVRDIFSNVFFFFYHCLFLKHTI